MTYASGAGGAVRIEGYNVTLNTVNALGGTDQRYMSGGQGRIVVYYLNSLNGFTSDPTAYAAVLGQGTTATPTPTPILTTPTPYGTNYGTGRDGNLMINSGNTFNINTMNTNPRFCTNGGDEISYSVTQLSTSSAQLSVAPSTGCLNMGDEIMLINLRGTPTNYVNTGNYEFLHVGSVINNTVYFTTPKIKLYGANVVDDSNIGTSSGQQIVVLVRVPNYQNVTINGELTANSWNGLTGGMIIFRASGTVSGNGFIVADGLGYRGDNTLGWITGITGEGPAANSTAFGGGISSGCGGGWWIWNGWLWCSVSRKGLWRFEIRSDHIWSRRRK